MPFELLKGSTSLGKLLAYRTIVDVLDSRLSFLFSHRRLGLSSLVEVVVADGLNDRERIHLSKTIVFALPVDAIHK